MDFGSPYLDYLLFSLSLAATATVSMAVVYFFYRQGIALRMNMIVIAGTVAAALGGFVFSILGALVSKIFIPYSYPHLIFLGIFLGILAQLGDLSESLIKRDCQVKDSGSILPGLGGVLDLVDSLLFTAPVFYFYMNILIIR